MGCSGGLPGEHQCGCPAGRLAVYLPTQGDMEHHTAGCLHPRETCLHVGAYFGGAVGPCIPRARAAGALVPTLRLPCGALKAARMMAPPASMALGTAQHGHVPSVGTRDGDQTSRARGCLAQPQPSPEVPNSCPGVPLCQVCVLRGALPARPPS